MGKWRSYSFNSLRKFFYYCFPVTSFLLLPFIQGTTPAFVVCFVLFFFIFLLSKKTAAQKFYLITGLLMGIFIFLNVLAQMGVLLFEIPSMKPMEAILVSPTNPNAVFLRSSVFTQLLYFFAAIISFAFVTVFFTGEKDISLIYIGMRFLIIYGLIEFFVFFVTGNKIDFLSNRTFGDNEAGSGSLFQTFVLGNFSIERMKSLTGEPSMFSLTILPFWVFAIEKKRKWDIILTSIALLLSFSTTAYLGAFIYVLYQAVLLNWKKKLIMLTGILAFIGVIILIGGSYVYELWNSIFISKFTADSVSGQDRSMGFESAISFWNNANLWTKMFGIGFGIIRSTDFFSTILVNNGVVGLFFWTAVFFLPFIPWRKNYFKSELKKLFPVIIVIYITLMISVPEYMYLSVWIPLGMAYNLFFGERIKYG